MNEAEYNRRHDAYTKRRDAGLLSQAEREQWHREIADHVQKTERIDSVKSLIGTLALMFVIFLLVFTFANVMKGDGSHDGCNYYTGEDCNP